MRLTPHTDEVFATARDSGVDVSAGVIGMTAVAFALWPTWLWAATVILASMVLVLWVYQFKRTKDAPGPTGTQTATAWAAAPAGASVARTTGEDADVIVWRRPEPEVLLSALGIPAGMAAIGAGMMGIRALVHSTPVFHDLFLYDTELSTTLVIAVVYALAVLATYACSTPLRRRVRREDHLRIRGRHAALVEGETTHLFSLDDVVSLSSTDGAVCLGLLDGRELRLSTTVPTELVAMLRETVDTLAEPEPPPEMQRLHALRRPE